jgi:hypothetical protein
MIALSLFILLYVALILDLPAGGPLTGARVDYPTQGWLATTGRVVWPGTTVDVRAVDDQTVLVERKWLYWWEARETVERDDRGWVLASEISSGPANVVQILVLFVAPVLTAFLFLRWKKKPRLPGGRVRSQGSG